MSSKKEKAAQKGGKPEVKNGELHAHHHGKGGQGHPQVQKK